MPSERPRRAEYVYAYHEQCLGRPSHLLADLELEMLTLGPRTMYFLSSPTNSSGRATTLQLIDPVSSLESLAIAGFHLIGAT